MLHLAEDEASGGLAAWERKEKTKRYGCVTDGNGG
jgi:hypothetical protein